MQNFKDLVVWQEAHKFSLRIYELTARFPKEEIFGITSQIRRASVSIACNIAEGCGRHTSRDFANFLQISLGSANETDHLILLARDLNYISTEQYEGLQESINKIRAMNIKLINKVRSHS